MELKKIDEKLYGDPVDYSKEENWLIQSDVTKEVDTFYIYPAAYLGPDDEFLPFSKIDNEYVKGAGKYFLKSQGSAFAEDTNVFTPYYRQFDPRVAITYIKEDKLDLVSELWSRDIVDSFDYYIKNLNNGRPFILAGHSQGSRLFAILLETYLKENKDIYERMVAAYLIGDSITKNYLEKNPHLKFAEKEDDTGVIISWNVEHLGITDENPLLLDGCIAINPLNWKRDETPAGVELNISSYLKKGEVKPGIADAKINLERGSLQCSTVDKMEYKPPMDIFPIGTYHSMDYGFYYGNIKKNVKVRVNAFLNK